MGRGLLIVVSGPAGSGKGTITKELVKRYPELFYLSVSYTTREPREHEVEGIHYHYASREEFESLLKKDGFMEHNCYCGTYYGTPKEPATEAISAGKNCILEIDVNGARQIKEKYPEAILIMLLAPSFAEQERRLRERGTETEEKIQARLAQTRSELQQLSTYDYLIYNETDHEEECLNDLWDIIRAQTHAVHQNPDAVEKYYASNDDPADI